MYVELCGRNHLGNKRYCLPEMMGRNRKLELVIKALMVENPARFERITSRSVYWNRDNV